jgi:hypothetical protein
MQKRNDAHVHPSVEKNPTALGALNARKIDTTMSFRLQETTAEPGYDSDV